MHDRFIRSFDKEGIKKRKFCMIRLPLFFVNKRLDPYSIVNKQLVVS